MPVRIVWHRPAASNSSSVTPLRPSNASTCGPFDPASCSCSSAPPAVEPVLVRRILEDFSSSGLGVHPVRRTADTLCTAIGNEEIEAAGQPLEKRTSPTPQRGSPSPVPDCLTKGCCAFVSAADSDLDGQTVTVTSVSKQYAWILVDGRVSRTVNVCRSRWA